MDTGRTPMFFALVALAFCLASAQTDKPATYVDHSNGVEVSIPGTTIPKDDILPTPRNQEAAPGGVIYKNGGNVFLQNEAGSIYTRPDGRKVLVGAGGQTIVTGADDSDEDTSAEGNYNGGGGGIFINGQQVGGGGGGSSFISGGGSSLFINQAGEGAYQTYNNNQIRIINGGLQLTSGGQVYTFPAKGADVNSKETVEINGQNAVVEYQNGNIIVELADGTVLAKADGGLFSGNRQSYDNRKQIQADAALEAARAQEYAASLQKNLHEQLSNQMRNLQEELQRTLGNIRIFN
ncbi:uncharacterized protein LOC6560117 [Drosophila grimshawi]|uniref:GH21071 n=1 Tax=Drosophila grimshawi TaxID=7222 RepID=B4J5K5_DROGR|nr:uncharacterized protein LOC6560117 [Drosophila grimshawi]EDW00768.1 GH21071 [Drosophila grimshawi]